jgi:hypothetical protein
MRARVSREPTLLTGPEEDAAVQVKEHIFKGPTAFEGDVAGMERRLISQDSVLARSQPKLDTPLPLSG